MNTQLKQMFWELAKVYLRAMVAIPGQYHVQQRQAKKIVEEFITAFEKEGWHE